MQTTIRTLGLMGAALMLVSGAAAADSDAPIADMQIFKNASQAVIQGPQKRFTGHATITPVFFPKAGQSDLSVGEVTFDPGARSAWHTHPKGQLLVVTKGQGWVQQEGQPKQLINAGDVVWTPAGVKHWHGATDTSAMTHYAIQEAVDGNNVNWLEKVSDKDYLSALSPAKLKALTHANTMVVLHPGHQADFRGTDKQYRGDAISSPLFLANDQTDLSAVYESFMPAAQTAWHTHPKGQLLIVTRGLGWVQQEGKAPQQVSSGDVVWTPAGVKHWHGAAKGSSLTEVAIQQFVGANAVTWLTLPEAQ